MTVSGQDREAIMARLDEIMQELVAIRRILRVSPQEAGRPGVTERLFGSLGHGTWDEYDRDLDWSRFCAR